MTQRGWYGFPVPPPSAHRDLTKHTLGSHRHQEAVQPLHELQVRTQLANVLLCRKHQQEVAVEIRLDGPYPFRRRHGIGDVDRPAFVSGKVHNEEVSPPPNGNLPHLHVKGDLRSVRTAEAEEDKGGAKSRVSAEVNLPAMGEPAQVPSLRFPYDSCRLGEAILLRYALNHLAGGPFVDNADGSLVSMDELVGERVYDELPHCDLLRDEMKWQRA